MPPVRICKCCNKEIQVMPDEGYAITCPCCGFKEYLLTGITIEEIKGD